jgi:hypothetical protein
MTKRIDAAKDSLKDYFGNVSGVVRFTAEQMILRGEKGRKTYEAVQTAVIQMGFLCGVDSLNTTQAYIDHDRALLARTEARLKNEKDRQVRAAYKMQLGFRADDIDIAQKALDKVTVHHHLPNSGLENPPINPKSKRKRSSKRHPSRDHNPR